MRSRARCGSVALRLRPAGADDETDVRSPPAASQRYALCSVLQVLVVLAVVAGVPSEAGLVALLVVSLPMFWAWGAFQADVAINPDLQGQERARWRIMLWLVPGSMAAYWYRYLRA